MSLDLFMFAISALVAVFGATMMIVQRNPVASVLYLILSLVAQAALYVQLGALFLGAILIVVYAGAIMVLFLFVIMLLNLRSSEDLGEDSSALGRFTRYLIGFLFMLELLFVIINGQNILNAVPGLTGTEAALAEFGSIKTVATRLFREYLYPFQLAGVLMLVAVVGAVVIAKTEDSDSEPIETGEEA